MFRYNRQNNVYVIGDPHIGEINLIRKARQQFETCEEHNEYLIKQWNKVVKSDTDVVFVLGDIGRNREMIKEVFSRLNGYKIMIAGNHDSLPKIFFEEIFDEVYWHPYYLTDRLLLSHIPRMIEDGNINVHGHTHWIYLDSDKHFNVSCEMVDFKPVPITKFEKILSRRPRENIKFLNEWFKDIQKVDRPDKMNVVLDVDGHINIQETYKLRKILRDGVDSQNE